MAGQRHARAGIDAQGAVRRFDRHGFDVYSEEVGARGPVCGPRPDVDYMRHQLLAVAAFRLQPERAPREADRALITVRRDMADVVDHARPVSFSGRLALAPCGK